MVISILGCGWYGKALGRSLLADGFKVMGSTTAEEKLAELAISGIAPYLVRFNADSAQFDEVFFECDILVVSITPGFRRGESDAYLPKMERIIDAIILNGIEKVILISSTGVYGDRNAAVTEEDDPRPDTESGKLLLAAENLFRQQKMFKSSIIRFAGLTGPGRNPGRFFEGRVNIPDGLAPVNLIHLDDCVGITRAVIQKEAYGYVFNAVTPHHPVKSLFYSKAASAIGLVPPQFINDSGAWKIVNGKQVKEILAYDYKIADWDNCDFG